MKREQATPTRRAVAYIRESTEEQGRGYSPDGQRQAIARYAADHGMQLADEYLDFETGREADKRARISTADRGCDGAPLRRSAVYHTSRFARNTLEAKRYKKLLRSELGIDVISVTQPLGADDPAAFLSESVHEIFDEYYSVSLSFWTKMGLREKARQGLLTGSLPWGYVKGEDGVAVPNPEKAPYVRRLFEMYATGQHTDRTLSAWLNIIGQLTARGRAFGIDTVREMLCNAAYAGYVSGHRDTSKTIKGLHEPSSRRHRSTACSSYATTAPARFIRDGHPRATCCAVWRPASAARARCTAPPSGASSSRATTAPTGAPPTTATSRSCMPIASRRSSSSS